MSGLTTRFLFDGVNFVQEQSSNGTPIANLFTGLTADEVFSRTDAGGTGVILADAIGSTMEITDGAGATRTHYTFEPFGATNATGDGNANAQQFTGRENDLSGLYFYRARYYHPGLGRFISEDPLGYLSGVNFYLYAGSNPVGQRDPSGLDWLNNLADASAGMGSALTGGITDIVNDWTGGSSVVNSCSGWYTAGQLTGAAVDIGLGAGAGAELGADSLVKRAGQEWSHAIPDRWKAIPQVIRDSRYNGRYVTPLEHSRIDPYRLLKDQSKWGDHLYPYPERMWKRMPPWAQGASVGAGVGAAGVMAGRSCGCK